MLTATVGRRSVAAMSFASNWPAPLAEGAMFVARKVSGKSLDGLLRHVGERWRTLGARCLLVLLFAIFPLAEASPPDPLWVGGIYDGADLDDVVAAVTAATAVVARTVLLLLGPTVIVAKAVLLADRASLPRPSLPAHPVRAPPSFTLAAAASLRPRQTSPTQLIHVCPKGRTGAPVLAAPHKARRPD